MSILRTDGRQTDGSWSLMVGSNSGTVNPLLFPEWGLSGRWAETSVKRGKCVFVITTVLLKTLTHMVLT